MASEKLSNLDPTVDDSCSGNQDEVRKIGNPGPCRVHWYEVTDIATIAMYSLLPDEEAHRHIENVYSALALSLLGTGLMQEQCTKHEY